jgi:two-component system, cell cycle sensor histidine kinase and response regulator CckA
VNDRNTSPDDAGSWFRELIENLPLVTYVDDGPGGGTERTVYVSPQIEAMLGYSAEEWLDDPDLFLRVLHPDDRDRMQAERASQSDRDTSRVFRVVARDGRVYTVQSERVVVRDGQGAARYTQGFWVDISDRVRIESELRDAQKREAVGRLAGAVAHDFNNILTAIAGYADLARTNLARPAALLRALTAIEEAAEAGSSLSRQLLAFSRREARQAAPTQLNDVVRATMTLLDRLIPASIVVELELTEPLPEIVADSGQLGQIVLNLTLNARDAMPTGGRLTIGTEAVPDGVVLVVTDTGVGMSDEVRAQAFEHFFTTKDPDRGTGLGLSTVLEIVEESSGTVELESELGAGTTVRITLPAAVEAPVGSDA